MTTFSGSVANDTFTGTSSDDSIDGFDGNDDLSGADGHDTLNGGNGNDRLNGGAGNDWLAGGTGEDLLHGAAGDDTLDGGAITDRYSYTDANEASWAGATAGIVVDLTGVTGGGTTGSGTAQDGMGGSDTLRNLQQFVGSDFADRFTASGALQLEAFRPGAGNDTIDGVVAVDTVGRAWRFVTYADASGPIAVDLQAGFASGSSIGTDSLLHINAVASGSGSDTLLGSDATHVWELFDGHAGDDQIDGRGGVDIVDYHIDEVSSGVVVDLAAGTASDGLGGHDSLAHIEGAFGSIRADQLSGSDAGSTEYFIGAGDNDTLDGRGGPDIAMYRFARAAVQVTLPGHGSSTASDGETTTDTLIGIEGAFGSPFADRLDGSDAADITETLEGFAGDDTLDGGDGADEASYEYAYDRGAVVDLLQGMASEDGFGHSDSLRNIEDVTGSRLFGDFLGGDNGANRMRGLGGDDTLDGRAGNDEFWPGTGHDSVDGGSGMDTVYIGAPHEGFTFSQPDATSLRLLNAALDIDVTVRNVEVLVFQPYTVFPGTLLAHNVASALADALWDGAGNQTVDALAGDDNLISNDGDDLLLGNDGDDWLQPEAGSDSADGGAGFDTLRLSGNRADYVVSAAAGYDLRLERSGVQTVYLRNVERVSFLDGLFWIGALLGSANVATPLADDLNGTNAADNVSGLAGNDSVSGQGGDDTFDGGPGDDTLVGGDGVDSANYAGAAAGVAASLGSGAVSGGAGRDLLFDIENLIGGPFDDSLAGDRGDNLIDGQAGNDTLQGGGAGSDSFVGGPGDDLFLGGSDTSILSYAGSPAGVVVALPAGHGLMGSAGDGFGGDDRIAEGAADQLIGSPFADSLTGSDNYFSSGGDALGDDTIFGLDGDDTLRGLEGQDHLDGGAGNDLVVGDGASADADNFARLIGGPGDDTIDGSGGFALADYADAPAAVTVNLGSGSASDGWGGSDTLRNLIAVAGSAFADTLVGDDEALNVFVGLAGNDTIDGRGGIDWIDHSEALGPVSVSLVAGSASGAGVGNDTLLNIENVGGSDDFGDTLRGSEAANVLQGYGGNDSLVGAGGDDTLQGDSGNDTLDGGAGSDWAFYDDARQSVFVNLATGTGSGGLGNDSLIGIEHLRGGQGNDGLRGDGSDNQIDGGAGNDDLRGGSGNDTLLGGAGTDNLRGEAGDDRLDGGAILDRINFSDLNFANYSEDPGPVEIDLGDITGDGSSGSGSARDGWGHTDVLINVDVIVGSAHADRITGSGALIFEQFEGRTGDDTIDGGAIRDRIWGRDANRASYGNAPSAVNADLAAGEAFGGDGHDTLVNINQLRGSPYGDTLLGSDRSDVNEQFDGRGGNDLIDGRGGFDWARYDFAPSAVVANLIAGTVQGGWGGTDTLLHIENLLGSSFDDRLSGGLPDNGSTNAGYLPSDGLERFEGGAGNDTIDGGQGFDRAEYSRSTSGVVAALNADHTGSADDGLGGTDTLLNIEGLLGSAFGDRLAGSDQPFESFNGRAGDDTLDGGGGRDLVDYRNDERQGIVLDLQAHSATDGFGDHDTVLNMEIVFGSSFADSIRGADQADHERGETLRGGGGNDTLDGGGGVDNAEWTAARGGFTVSRQPGTGVITVIDHDTTNGDAGTDTLAAVERLVFGDETLAFGARAEEVVRVAFVLWTKDIVGSASLFARGLSFYDVGWDFTTLCFTALQFFPESPEALVHRLIVNSGSAQSEAQLLQFVADHGGGIAGLAAAVAEIAMDPATAALIEASGIRSTGLVAANVVPGFIDAMFALTTGG